MIFLVWLVMPSSSPILFATIAQEVSAARVFDVTIVIIMGYLPKTRLVRPWHAEPDHDIPFSSISKLFSIILAGKVFIWMDGYIF